MSECAKKNEIPTKNNGKICRNVQKKLRFRRKYLVISEKSSIFAASFRYTAQASKIISDDSFDNFDIIAEGLGPLLFLWAMLDVKRGQ